MFFQRISGNPFLWFVSALPIFLKFASFSFNQLKKLGQKMIKILLQRRRIQIYLLLMRKNLYMDSQDDKEGINWNPNSSLQEQELHLVNCSMLDSEVMESQRKRPSHKNKYINKITLIKPEETISTKKKKSCISKDSSIHPEQFKKMKNREAAKESRQRKKLYINLIEQQTKMLEKELEATNKQIENCKMQIQKSTFSNNQFIGTFDSKMAHVDKKIERLLAMEVSDERDNELNLAIDSIFYRFGAIGKERKNNINQSYKKVMSVAPPILHRYLLWSANDKAHLFVTPQTENSENQIWFQQFKKMILSNIIGKQVFLQGKRQQFVEKLRDLQRCVTQLRQTKNQIQKLCSILDNLFQQIRQILTPIQSAKLFKFIEKFKYRQQLRFIQRLDPQQLNHLNIQTMYKKEEQ